MGATSYSLRIVPVKVHALFLMLQNFWKFKLHNFYLVGTYKIYENFPLWLPTSTTYSLCIVLTMNNSLHTTVHVKPRSCLVVWRGICYRQHTLWVLKCSCCNGSTDSVNVHTHFENVCTKVWIFCPCTFKSSLSYGIEAHNYVVDKMSIVGFGLRSNNAQPTTLTFLSCSSSP